MEGREGLLIILYTVQGISLLPFIWLVFKGISAKKKQQPRMGNALITTGIIGFLVLLSIYSIYSLFVFNGGSLSGPGLLETYTTISTITTILLTGGAIACLALAIYFDRKQMKDKAMFFALMAFTATVLLALSLFVF